MPVPAYNGGVLTCFYLNLKDRSKRIIPWEVVQERVLFWIDPVTTEAKAEAMFAVPD